MPVTPPEHRPAAARRHVAPRKDFSAATRYYSSQRWILARAAYLRRNPLCVACQAQGRVTASNTVDHVRPHRGDLIAFWDEGNWQALCRPCHSAKTVTQDGGFGRQIK